MKDPLPDNLSWHGVTLYGTIDVGAAYQNHGAPLSGAVGTGLEYNITGSSDNHQDDRIYRAERPLAVFRRHQGRGKHWRRLGCHR